jgi:glycine cleavage system protein P-like pyridoxal-binding family
MFMFIEVLAFEPTGTEGLETIDGFCGAMIRIAGEAREATELVKSRP